MNPADVNDNNGDHDDKDDKPAQNHLHPFAANALTSLLSSETHAMSGLAAQLRGTANFIRRHGRPPRTTAEITDPNLLTYLRESDAFLEFFEGLAPETPAPDEPR